MTIKPLLTATFAAALLAGAGLSPATAATQNALDLALPAPALMPSAAAEKIAPAGERAETPQERSAIDDCFAYATGSGQTSLPGPIPRFASRPGPGAEEQAFQRQLKGAAPGAPRERLFAHCLAAK